jgi:type III secretory pathway component EscV
LRSADFIKSDKTKRKKDELQKAEMSIYGRGMVGAMKSVKREKIYQQME